MTDHVNSSGRSKIMKQVAQKNTRPERSVRSLLHKMGYRFRLHRKDLPGTPDIVLPSRKIAIFVHGCFWHGHLCRWGQLPKSNLEYWGPKISGNKDRDLLKKHQLETAGWCVIEVWQCYLKDPQLFEVWLLEALGPPGCRSTTSVD